MPRRPPVYSQQPYDNGDEVSAIAWLMYCPRTPSEVERGHFLMWNPAALHCIIYDVRTHGRDMGTTRSTGSAPCTFPVGASAGGERQDCFVVHLAVFSGALAESLGKLAHVFGSGAVSCRLLPDPRERLVMTLALTTSASLKTRPTCVPPPSRSNTPPPHPWTHHTRQLPRRFLSLLATFPLSTSLFIPTAIPVSFLPSSLDPSPSHLLLRLSSPVGRLPPSPCCPLVTRRISRLGLVSTSPWRHPTRYRTGHPGPRTASLSPAPASQQQLDFLIVLPSAHPSLSLRPVCILNTHTHARRPAVLDPTI